MTATFVMGAISWVPHIRGALVAAIGIAIFMGSIYLIVGTNVGLRTGFLVSLAALFGWMSVLGVLWWVAGTGLRGQDPSWIGQEVNFNREAPLSVEIARDLPPPSELPDAQALLEAHPDVLAEILSQEGEDFVAQTLTDVATLAPDIADEVDLGEWEVMSEADQRRGEAVAAADAVLIGADVFGAASEYIVQDVFLTGGETRDPEDDIWEQAWSKLVSVVRVRAPAQYAVVTLVKAADVEVVPGQAPPPPTAEEGASVMSVIMLRNQGNMRVVPALFTFASTAVFAAACWMLHTRDIRIAEMRAAEAAKG